MPSLGNKQAGLGSVWTPLDHGGLHRKQHGLPTENTERGNKKSPVNGLQGKRATSTKVLHKPDT